MLVQQIHSVLSDQSYQLLQTFFEGCPVEIDLSKVVLELGTLPFVDPTLELNSEAVYEVRPFRLCQVYNPRTMQHSLVWELNEVTRDFTARRADFGSALPPLMANDSPAIWLADSGITNNRRHKAWFNSKEDTLSYYADHGDPLTLTFVGEYVSEFDVPV